MLTYFTNLSDLVLDNFKGWRKISFYQAQPWTPSIFLWTVVCITFLVIFCVCQWRFLTLSGRRQRSTNILWKRPRRCSHSPGYCSLFGSWIIWTLINSVLQTSANFRIWSTHLPKAGHILMQIKPITYSFWGWNKTSSKIDRTVSRRPKASNSLSVGLNFTLTLSFTATICG